MIASAVSRRASTPTPGAGLDCLPHPEVRAMWPLQHLRSHPLKLPLLLAALAAVAGTPAATRAQQPNAQQPIITHSPGFTQPPVDRVELLRRVVESPAATDEQLLVRGEELKKRVDALQTLGELRRALQLSEWSRTDDKLNPKRSDQDQLYRQRIGGRFKATVEFFLSPKNADAAVRLALITMIG